MIIAKLTRMITRRNTCNYVFYIPISWYKKLIYEKMQAF